MRLVRLPGVFRPRSDTWLLASALRSEGLPPGATVLDVCAGAGALAVAAARAGAGRVTAVDVSRRAVACCRLNGPLNGVSVRARRGDLLAAVPGCRFDLILSNPPYVPAEQEALPRRGAARAWDAGPDGRAIIDRLCAEAPAHLRPGGVLLMVHSSLCGVPETLRRLDAAGLEAGAVLRLRGPLGPLMSRRAALLEGRGLLPPGSREEDLVVVRGRAPGPQGPFAGNGAAAAAGG